MSTDAISSSTATSSSSSSSSSTSSSTSSLDENAFLQLMVTEMENQDPTNPMDDTQYASQLAQYSSLEQMTQVNTNLKSLTSAVSSGFTTVGNNSASLQAFSMVGATVNYLASDDATTASTGVVSGVYFSDGTPMLKIGNNTVSLSNVVSVEPTSSD